MANAKISALNAITGANTATGDLIPIVDISASETKSITRDEMKAALLAAPGAIGGTTPAAGSFTTLSAAGALTTAGLKEDASGNLGLGVTPSAADSGGSFSLRNGAIVKFEGINGNYATNASYVGDWKYLTTGAATLFNPTAGTYAWLTAPSGTAGAAITFTQAMTLDASGNLLVGTTNPLNASNSGHYFDASSASSAGIAHQSGTASSAEYTKYIYNTSTIGSITQNGTTAVAYNTTSDHRLKENVRPANAARFMDIEFVDFEWTDGRHDCGVIADQLQSVYPDLVLGAKDATEVRTVEITPAVAAVLDAEGVEVTPAVPAVTEEQTFPVYQQVNYMGLIGRMGTRIQQQQRLIEAMEARLTALEAA